jgi:Undecaprenyl-phosphate glucose phosphotransferase
VAALDFCLVAGAAAVAFVLYFEVQGDSTATSPHYTLTSIFAATLFVAMFERSGGYRLKRLQLWRWQLRHVLMLWAVAVAVLLFGASAGKIADIYSLGWGLVWFGTTASLLMTERGILHFALTRWVKAGYLTRNVVILGAGSEGERVIAKLQHSQDPTIAICGLFDDHKSQLPRSVHGLSVLGTTNDLIRFARCNPVDEVIVALPLDAERQLRGVFAKLKGLAVDLRLSIEPVARRYEVHGVSYLGGVPILEIADRPLKHWRAVAKWMEDKVLSALLLFGLAPLMAGIAIVIKLNSPGPVFFAQERFGLSNNVIRVLKFRTMHVGLGDPSGSQRTVRNDPRVTGVGRVLRWLSLDELPQLINVLRGDMSLVGPRPHAIAMKAGGHLYGDAVEEYLHRHRVKPGITGWAQVNGLRGEVDTLEKAHRRLDHDLYYIDHWSPWLDLKILLMTISIVVAPENVY